MDLKITIGQMLDKTLQLAKQNREKIHYSNVDGFPQAILILGPALEVASLPARWRNEREKYQFMRVVREAAKRSLATAVILVSDTRWLEEETICEKFGIPPTHEIGLERFRELYQRAVTERFKGYVGNMPSDWYTEAIMTIAKGPTIPVMTRSAHYKQGPRDSIQWIEPKYTHTKEIFNLLPDWWC